ncbi:hypothetical protein S4A8_14384 [Salinisphaera sp. S4-8]
MPKTIRIRSTRYADFDNRASNGFDHQAEPQISQITQITQITQIRKGGVQVTANDRSLSSLICVICVDLRMNGFLISDES